MAHNSANKNTDDFSEFPVKREKFCGMFSPPLPKSTFYDRVREGKITPMKQCSGYYLLNASRVRLGLPPVKELPGGVGACVHTFADCARWRAYVRHVT